MSITDMYYGASPRLFEFSKSLRQHPTPAEEFLWEYLKESKLGYKFRRQHPVAWFIADLFCHSAKLIIEIDGGYHNFPEQFQYDEGRTAELEELGLKVIRFTNEEVLNTPETVVRTVKENLPAHPLTP